MVKKSIVTSIRKYLKALFIGGIHARRAILYGSYANGKSNKWSDIDLIVIAPEFDGVKKLELVEKLWVKTLEADIRIEPIACGEIEWETDVGRPILEIARREGVEIKV